VCHIANAVVSISEAAWHQTFFILKLGGTSCLSECFTYRVSNVFNVFVFIVVDVTLAQL